MIHTAPGDEAALRELEFDEAMEGGGCGEAKCMDLKQEHQDETIEIISGSEEEQEEAHRREHMRSEIVPF